MWHIEIKMKNPFATRTGFSVGSNPFLALECASKAYPESIVSLSAMARNRRVMLNGKVISDKPDLSEFYLNMDPQTLRDWELGGELMGEQ